MIVVNVLEVKNSCGSSISLNDAITQQRKHNIQLMMTKNNNEQQQIVTPGSIIGYTDNHTPGAGTYTRNGDGRIYSSLVGIVQTIQKPNVNDTLIVTTPGTLISDEKRIVVVPEIGDIVTCRVEKINPMMARVEILCVSNTALDPHTSFSGIIRVQDVRATEIDKVQMQHSYRPGDIVRARVISLGDSRSYYLSSASNDLGVIYATSAVGNAPMIPVSWNEMQCSKTGLREHRKVAKTDLQQQ
jgi:exosome complex component CSL4